MRYNPSNFKDSLGSVVLKRVSAMAAESLVNGGYVQCEEAM